MASTTELINYLKIQAPGWNRSGEKGLLEVLNQAQDILYMQDTQQSVGYKANGELPSLVTIDGQFEYSLSKTATGLLHDLWRIEQVLTKKQIFRDYNIYENEDRRIIDFIRYNGIEYYKHFHIQSEDSAHNTPPIIRFTKNPGDTTDTYFIYGYKKANKLLSESIKISLPESIHFTCLLPTAMKLLEGYQNGNFIEALTYINETLKPMVQDEMNSGEQGVYNHVTRREE